MTTRCLLMIAYYFPPLGMGGVQRPLKFAKYLPDFGWDVEIITATPRSYHATDETLLNDIASSVTVHRVAAFDPAALVRRSANSESKGTEPRSLGSLTRALQQWSRWPDDKLHFARAAAREALRLSETRGFNAIYTTSPPPSVHSTGLRLQKSLRIPWVADFRDPWLTRADDWGPTELHRRYAKRLRARILRTANHTIAMNDRVADEFKRDGVGDVSIIPNGFDESDFHDLSVESEANSSTIIYYGTVSPQSEIDPLLHLVDRANAQSPTLRIRIEHIGQTIGRAPVVHANYQSLGYLSHRDAIRRLCAADIVALSLKSDDALRMTIPGRTYEALRSLRPILAFAPRNSMFATELSRHDAVWICDESEPEASLQILNSILAMDRRGPMRRVEAIKQFDRRFQTALLAGILDRLNSSPASGRCG